MCQFLSAIATRDGRIICKPEATDHHHELLLDAGIPDDKPAGQQNFVRFELKTDDPTQLADPDAYKLVLDETSRPAWYDEAMEFDVADQLRDRVRAMIVTDDRPILLGGVWILAEGATVAETKNCRIVAMLGNAHVGGMWDSSKVGEMRGSSNVGEMRGSSKVGVMRGSSKVGVMRESSKVGGMWDSSKVGEMWQSSNVGGMWGSSKVSTDYRKTTKGA